MRHIHSFIGVAILSGGMLLGLTGTASAQHRGGGHGGGGHGGGGHGGGHSSGHGGYGGHGYSHGGYYGSHAGHYYPSVSLGFGYGYGYPYYGSYSPRTVYVNPNTYSARYYEPPVATVASNRARLQVLVPDADVEVWIQGQKASNKGMTRMFESPDLEPGKSYAYTVRASWYQGGRTVTEERKIDVTPGQMSVVDFGQQPAPERAPQPVKQGETLPK